MGADPPWLVLALYAEQPAALQARTLKLTTPSPRTTTLAEVFGPLRRFRCCSRLHMHVAQGIAVQVKEGPL